MLQNLHLKTSKIMLMASSSSKDVNQAILCPFVHVHLHLCVQTHKHYTVIPTSHLSTCVCDIQLWTTYIFIIAVYLALIFFKKSLNFMIPKSSKTNAISSTGLHSSLQHSILTMSNSRNIMLNKVYHGSPVGDDCTHFPHFPIIFFKIQYTSMIRKH